VRNSAGSADCGMHARPATAALEFCSGPASDAACTRRRGCRDCGTHVGGESGGSEGGCVERRAGAECACAFHRRSEERWLNKIVERAVASPHFLSRCRWVRGKPASLKQM
jgi:hypothetical protein